MTWPTDYDPVADFEAGLATSKSTTAGQPLAANDNSAVNPNLGEPADETLIMHVHPLSTAAALIDGLTEAIEALRTGRPEDARNRLVEIVPRVEELRRCAMRSGPSAER